MSRLRLWWSLIFCSFVLVTPASATERETGYIQVLLGQLKLNDNNVTATRDGTEYEGELDDIPYMGAAVQMPWHDEIVGYGWEGGGFVSWINDEVSYLASSGPQGGQLRIAVDNAFWSIETFLGLWASLRPIDRVRMYVGAGPLVMFGRADAEGPDEGQQPTPVGNAVVVTDDDSHDSDWSVGGYARAGLEIRITDKTWFGLSVRHMKTDMDLESSIGQFDVDGNLYQLSVTNQF